MPNRGSAGFEWDQLQLSPTTLVLQPLLVSGVVFSIGNVDEPTLLGSPWFEHLKRQRQIHTRMLSRKPFSKLGEMGLLLFERQQVFSA
mgnify:CR=1 FL=1